ncbi:MAG TPA: M14 family metallopeptidase [Abditibacteriaceae bacterium]|nr:M14 family metallopeptidase [Abditibacteriaceae bacterium]
MAQPVELKRKTITGAQDGPHLLILGGVHGDEFEPMAALRRLIRELDPDQLRGRVTLVPVVNEAAFLLGQRTAEDGLDLARTCPGRADGSITERTAYAVSELIKNADYMIDLHTGGNAMWVAPLTGYALHPDGAVLAQQRRMARAFNLPLVWGTSARLDGRTLSVARDHRVPAIYAEWMGAGICEAPGVDVYVEGCLNVMAGIGMIARQLPESSVERIIEDDREGSGHLQLNYPSPMSGFFEATVALHQAVSIGDVLGIVTDPLGEQTATISAVHEGTVLCLRAFPQVREGDCLAVVLETV